MIESHFYVMSMMIHLAHGPLSYQRDLVALYAYWSYIRKEFEPAPSSFSKLTRNLLQLQLANFHRLYKHFSIEPTNIWSFHSAENILIILESLAERQNVMCTLLLNASL